jgi:hypothetical protein
VIAGFTGLLNVRFRTAALARPVDLEVASGRPLSPVGFAADVSSGRRFREL